MPAGGPRGTAAYGGGVAIEAPMWNAGQKRLLGEVLAVLPRVSVWRLQWFDGVVDAAYGGAPPIDQWIDQRLDDADLRRLAAALVDLNEIVLVAEVDGGSIRLACEDSTRWVVEASGTWSDAEKGLEALG